MEKIKFFAKCIFPTTTLEGGKWYEVINEEDYDITVINDKGNKVTVARYRFDKIEARKIEKMDNNKVKCVDTGKFKNLTKDKEYEVLREMKTKYLVKNDKGVEALYGKKYFSKVIEKIVEKKPSVRKKVAEKTVMCLYPISDVLTFRKTYTVFEKDDKEKKIFIKDDTGRKEWHLAKRFK